MPTCNVTIKFPAMPFWQATLFPDRCGINVSLDLSEEDIHTWFITISCRSLGAHFERPRARGNDCGSDLCWPNTVKIPKQFRKSFFHGGGRKRLKGGVQRVPDLNTELQSLSLKGLCPQTGHEPFIRLRRVWKTLRSQAFPYAPYIQ